jgi:uncharacterized protein
MTLPHSHSLLHLDGPAGKLEIAIQHPTSPRKNKWAIVCHPHPLHGGTMQNKVVTTTAKTLCDLGFTTIRFNYRGVGESEGLYGEAHGETDDLKFIMDWILKQNREIEIVLAGFSFGAYIAARMASRKEVTHLITIAPSINHFDFNHMHKPHGPWLIIHGEFDELVPFAEAQSWALTLKQVDFIKIAQASHFFHGKLVDLRKELTQWLSTSLLEPHP